MQLFRQKGFGVMREILIVAITLLIISNVATIWWFIAGSRAYNRLANSGQSNITPQAKEKTATTSETEVAASSSDEIAPLPIVDPDDPDGDLLSNEEEAKYGTDSNKPDTDGDSYTDRQEVDSGYDPLRNEKDQLGQDKILVKWQEWPVRTDSNFIYNNQALENFVKKANDGSTVRGYERAFEVYKLGEVSEGIYKGRNLNLVIFSDPYGMGQIANYFRTIQEKEPGLRPIILTNHSQTIYGVMEVMFDIDRKTTIANLEPLSEISIPKSKLKLIKSAKEPFILLNDIIHAHKLFSIGSNEWMYKSDNNGCFFTRAKDGTARYYFFNWQTKPRDNFDRFQSFVDEVTIFLANSNTTLTANYAYSTIAGCGLTGCYSYPKYISTGQLKELGAMKNGEKIYELKNEKFSYVADGNINVLLKGIYDQYYPGQEKKLSYEEFLKNKPLIYWQDPFGGLVEMRNAKFQPAVECGKPVIYLYPTRRMEVSVKVTPSGGFSLTEPEYGQGWEVEADPSGELKNLSDGKIYPYLFWEGIGLNYQQPEEGFVVSKDEMENFLKDKLSRLGLNASEAGEFMEFWLPLMQAKPYYFVTFLPQEQFDQLAPLSVDPQPDTVIRVFMDFTGLDRKVPVREQRIVTPKRKGFTVVEWGGALHK